MQFFSNPGIEHKLFALPDCETFHLNASEVAEINQTRQEWDEALEPGWFWHPCFPGCLPDGAAVGPFATEAEAIADAQGEALDEFEL